MGSRKAEKAQKKRFHSRWSYHFEMRHRKRECEFIVHTLVNGQSSANATGLLPAVIGVRRHRDTNGVMSHKALVIDSDYRRCRHLSRRWKSLKF